MRTYFKMPREKNAFLHAFVCTTSYDEKRTIQRALLAHAGAGSLPADKLLAWTIPFAVLDMLSHELSDFYPPASLNHLFQNMTRGRTDIGLLLTSLEFLDTFMGRALPPAVNIELYQLAALSLHQLYLYTSTLTRRYPHFSAETIALIAGRLRNWFHHAPPLHRILQKPNVLAAAKARLSGQRDIHELDQKTMVQLDEILRNPFQFNAELETFVQLLNFAPDNMDAYIALIQRIHAAKTSVIAAAAQVEGATEFTDEQLTQIKVIIHAAEFGRPRNPKNREFLNAFLQLTSDKLTVYLNNTSLQDTRTWQAVTCICHMVRAQSNVLSLTATQIKNIKIALKGAGLKPKTNSPSTKMLWLFLDKKSHDYQQHLAAKNQLAGYLANPKNQDHNTYVTIANIMAMLKNYQGLFNLATEHADLIVEAYRQQNIQPTIGADDNQKAYIQLYGIIANPKNTDAIARLQALAEAIETNKLGLMTHTDDEITHIASLIARALPAKPKSADSIALKVSLAPPAPDDAASADTAPAPTPFQQRAALIGYLSNPKNEGASTTGDPIDGSPRKTYRRCIAILTSYQTRKIQDFNEHALKFLGQVVAHLDMGLGKSMLGKLVYATNTRQENNLLSLLSDETINVKALTDALILYLAKIENSSDPCSLDNYFYLKMDKCVQFVRTIGSFYDAQFQALLKIVTQFRTTVIPGRHAEEKNLQRIARMLTKQYGAMPNAGNFVDGLHNELDKQSFMVTLCAYIAHPNNETQDLSRQLQGKLPFIQYFYATSPEQTETHPHTWNDPQQAGVAYAAARSGSGLHSSPSADDQPCMDFFINQGKENEICIRHDRQNQTITTLSSENKKAKLDYQGQTTEEASSAFNLFITPLIAANATQDSTAFIQEIQGDIRTTINFPRLR